MRQLLSRIWLAFKYGPELDELLEQRRKEIRDEAFEAQRYYLDLCEKHQQRDPGAQHSSHNCDYCKALQKKGMSE